jgi:hypothetical protein
MLPAMFSVRIMSAADLDLAVEWAAAEGWNPGLDDAGVFRAADPRGFLMGLVDGEPATSISVVRYGEGFGFLGFYIAAPAFRGKGHGLPTWTAGMKHLGSRIVGLDGVPAQQANYAKSGFVLTWRNVRYVGRAPKGAMSPGSATLLDARAVPFDVVAGLDRAFFPAARDGFLSAWTTAAGRHALVAIDDGIAVGMGVARACREGFKIGPLYASTPEIAGRLFAALCDRLDGAQVSLDAPEPNWYAVRLAESYGFKPAFETARMYKGTAPECDLERLYSVTSFELG